jgi:hypothetical protein
MRFPRLILLVALSVLAVAGAASARAPAAKTYAYGSVTTAPNIHLVRGQAPAGFTGGPVTAATGETVNVYVADELLAADPTTSQRWADFVAGLVHGPELSAVSLYLAPLAKIRQICGEGALGCYDPSDGSLFAIGEDIRGVSAGSVVTHEYGHHIASNRRNDPWPAVDWGAKRWATYEHVCSKARNGQLVPGDEGQYYQLNPGEWWAETYRVLNERRAGLPEASWDVVDDSLYPDQQALDTLALDVTEPWAGNTTATYTGTMGPRASGRGFKIATAYDGELKVRLSAPRGVSFALRIVDPTKGKVLATGIGKSAQLTVCGERMVQVQVKRISGSGPFKLAVSKP